MKHDVTFSPSRPAPRILIVSDAWEPQVNGVVRSYQSMAREWRKIGFDVAIIGPVDFASFPLPGYPEISLALLPARRLAQMVTDFAPDHVHIAVEGPLGWAARRYCLRRRIGFSTTFHTNFPAYIALRVPRILRALTQRLTLAALRRFHDAATHTFVATPSLEEQLRGWGFRGTLQRLSRGVDTALFYPAHERPTPRCPTLLYVGRVAPEKSLERFLRITSAEIGAHRKVVVGDGPALAVLRRAYPDATFRGKLEGQALAEAYRAADVFVFPSRTDTFGIVLIEALASGLPIAAHDVPGPRDIVTDPGLGALEADLACAIRKALVAPGSRAARSKHAKATYDWAGVARDFLRHSDLAQETLSISAEHTVPAAK